MKKPEVLMPVSSSHLVNYKSLGVERRIREERQRKGLTLRQVAARLGVSEAKLSNVENDKVPIDLAEVAELAAALDTPVAAFLPRSRVSHYLIRRAQEIQTESPVMRKLAGPEPGPSTHHNPVWSRLHLLSVEPASLPPVAE